MLKRFVSSTPPSTTIININNTTPLVYLISILTFVIYHLLIAKKKKKNTPAMKNSHTQISTLHQYHVHKLEAVLYRTHSLMQILALVAIFYFRATFFFDKAGFDTVPFLPWLILFSAELLFSFIWLLKQPFYWRPITRTIFPENLPKDEQQLPGIDVFICTADPNREPTFDVMNTVISAMSLDYPAAKLSVYLSDDAGDCVTLNGMKEAWVFATWWLPFCKKYNVKTICPRAYFEHPEEASQSSEFIEDRSAIKEKYETFKLRVQSMSSRVETNGGPKTSVQDHPSLVQVINENLIQDDTAITNKERLAMPSLVYVSREKRPSRQHHFKAGALNVLLRISTTLSNSPYILVLDCDMYCNDSISARQAMCFYLDPIVSPTLGWVQYPQTFHNVNENDIYDSQSRFAWTTFWPGADGLQGPVITGTNFYINRKALYDTDIYNGNGPKGANDVYGLSNEFIKSLSGNDSTNKFNRGEFCSTLGKETKSLASCSYEVNTQWGEKVGFRYKTVAEDIMTGYILQSKGWRSVYLNPTSPQFLGFTTTNLNDLLIQNTRWATGLVEIGLSKYCPLFYSPSRMHILQRMTATYITLFPLISIPAWCFATVPLISFIYGIPLYPKVSNPYFIAFAYAFISSMLKLVYELMAAKGGSSVSSTLPTLLNEERTWMIKWLTCHVYGVADCVMTKLGLREASFIPTNKVDDDDTSRLYEMGKYDFRTSNMFLVPLVTAVSLNLCCLVGGIARLVAIGDWDSMFTQAIFSFYVFFNSFPVIEAMFLRRDKGCIPFSVTLKATLFVVGFLSFGYLFLLY